MRFKIMVEGAVPYKEMKKILNDIEKKGYKITLVDNGNIVCELEESDHN